MKKKTQTAMIAMSAALLILSGCGQTGGSAGSAPAASSAASSAAAPARNGTRNVVWNARKCGIFSSDRLVIAAVCSKPSADRR